MNEPLFPRRKTKLIRIGQVEIGGGRQIVVQSMTKTRTARIEPTVRQIKRLEKAGCQLVRLAVPEMDDALAIKEIKKKVSLPLVADIHFDPRLAIASIEAGVDGLRINPGTFGSKSKLKEVVERAGERKIPIRIGINSGSLDKDLRSKYGEVTPEAMVESALREIKLLEDQAGEHREVLYGYTAPLLNNLLVALLSGILITYCLYTFSSHPDGANTMMMLTIPFVLYGIFRYMVILQNSDLASSPEEVLLNDWPLKITVALWAISVVIVLYLFF